MTPLELAKARAPEIRLGGAPVLPSVSYVDGWESTRFAM